MKKTINYVLMALALFVFQNKAFATEAKNNDCNIIFYAETLYADKEVKLCEKDNKITYQFKNKNSSDSIIEVTRNKNEFYISKKAGELNRVWVNAGDDWYALEEDGGATTIWGYDASGLDVNRRSITSLQLRTSTKLRFRTLIFNRSLVNDLEEFDQWGKEIDKP